MKKRNSVSNFVGKKSESNCQISASTASLSVIQQDETVHVDYL